MIVICSLIWLIILVRIFQTVSTQKKLVFQSYRVLQESVLYLFFNPAVNAIC